MKKLRLVKGIFIIIILLIFCVTNFVQAQRRDNILKVGLIEPFLLTFSASFERFIPDNNISFQASASITQRKVTIWESLTPQITGFSTELQARYYVPVGRQSIPVGLYGGVFGEYSQYKMILSIPEGDINFLDGNSKFLGFVAGYQWGFNARLFIDLTVGGGYHIADYSGRFSEKGRLIPSIISNGILPKIDLKVGWGF